MWARRASARINHSGASTDGCVKRLPSANPVQMWAITHTAPAPYLSGFCRSGATLARALIRSTAADVSCAESAPLSFSVWCRLVARPSVRSLSSSGGSAIRMISGAARCSSLTMRSEPSSSSSATSRFAKFPSAYTCGARTTQSGVLAPQVYAEGNVANLEVALELLEGSDRMVREEHRAAPEIILIAEPPLEERDLTEGRATSLHHTLKDRGADSAQDTSAAVDRISALARVAPERQNPER